MEQDAGYFKFSKKEKTHLKTLIQLDSKIYEKLKELFFSDLSGVNPSLVSGRKKFVNLFIDKLKFNLEKSLAVFYGCHIILETSYKHDFDNLKKFLSYNDFNDNEINRIADLYEILLSSKTVELFNVDRKKADLEHKILPHVSNVKWVIDYRLNKTSDNYEFVPVLIGTFELHEPNHKLIKSDLYFQLTPDILDSFIEDLESIREELNKQNEHLEKYKDKK